MRSLRLAVIGTVVLIVGGCADRRDVLGPAAQARSASAARQIEASGHFDALVDFSTLTLTPRGQNCRLEVDGRLVFTGTLEGIGTGHTSALVFAPCSEVATTPPGTFPDVFRSELTFEGTVNGEPATAAAFYMGGVQPGGQIDGRLVFTGDVRGELSADAVVAVGGTYGGSVVVR